MPEHPEQTYNGIQPDDPPQDVSQSPTYDEEADDASDQG